MMGLATAAVYIVANKTSPEVKRGVWFAHGYRVSGHILLSTDILKLFFHSVSE